MRDISPSERAVRLRAALDHQTGCVLSQCRVDDKTNEHKAALPLLKDMVLMGLVIVVDALFYQRNSCQQIVDSGGDYHVSMKAIQLGPLRENEQELAADPAAN